MSRTTLVAIALLSLTGCNRSAAGHDPAGAATQTDSAGAARNQQASARFLAGNARQPGVTALPSGLQYKIVRSGPPDGEHPRPGDQVKVNYSGALVSGEVFDSTNRAGEPAVLLLQDLVPAWMEALPRMRPGDHWILYVPPALGYGVQGQPPTIPPNSVLVFDLELLGVLHTGATVRNG